MRKVKSGDNSTWVFDRAVINWPLCIDTSIMSVSTI